MNKRFAFGARVRDRRHLLGMTLRAPGWCVMHAIVIIVAVVVGVIVGTVSTVSWIDKQLRDGFR